LQLSLQAGQSPDPKQDPHGIRLMPSGAGMAPRPSQEGQHPVSLQTLQFVVAMIRASENAAASLATAIE
jgi:hypothetical protein